MQGLPLQNLLTCVPTPTRSPTMMLVSTWEPTRVAMRMISRPATGIACRCATSTLRIVRTATGVYRDAARTDRALHPPFASSGSWTVSSSAHSRRPCGEKRARARGRVAESVT
jgi:hypothetical protein